MPPTGDLAGNPGMCPDWESNQQPFGSQASTQSTELHQPGQHQPILIEVCNNSVFSFFYCCAITVVSISPPYSPRPYPHPPPTFNALLSLSMGPLYMFLVDLSLSLPHYPPLPSPLGTVSLFFISMSLVIFWSLCFFSPIIGPMHFNPEQNEKIFNHSPRIIIYFPGNFWVLSFPK